MFTNECKCVFVKEERGDNIEPGGGYVILIGLHTGQLGRDFENADWFRDGWCSRFNPLMGQGGTRQQKTAKCYIGTGFCLNDQHFILDAPVLPLLTVVENKQ